MPIFFFEKTRRGLLVFFSVKAWRFNFFFKKPDQLNLIKQGTFPFYEGLLGCPKKDHCGVNRPLQRGRVGCVRFWRRIAGMHGDMVMPWSSGGGIFLHSKNGGLGGGFKIFLFSPLPGQSDPIWRIEFCTCQPELDSICKGFTFWAEYFWDILVTKILSQRAVETSLVEVLLVLLQLYTTTIYLSNLHHYNILVKSSQSVIFLSVHACVSPSIDL